MAAVTKHDRADPARLVAELRRELAICRAELDAATAREAATAEILQVINSSPGDLGPVFDAMLEKAIRLCDASLGSLMDYDGEYFRTLAFRGPPTLGRFFSKPFRAEAGGLVERLVTGEPFAQVDDLAAVPAGSAQRRALIEEGGVRSMVWIALRKDSALLGMITIYRQQVRPFTDKEIALLQSFAAQAVIAMENARLLTETRERTHDLEESLEYQTATSDVLQVISGSTFDLDTILETVASSAYRLCRADYAVIFRNEGGEYRWAAGYGISAAYAEHERRSVIRPGAGTVIGRAVLEARAVHIEDAWADPLYEDKAAVQTAGNIARSMLGVPLLRDGTPIGAIGLARNRVEPFSERETQLVTTFADQAVIAIENARLLTETREALEQQTATAEVLGVINSSPGDLAPVFEAILEKAHTLCGAPMGSLVVREGEQLRALATRGYPPEYEALAREGFPIGTLSAIANLLNGETVHFPDIAAMPIPSAETPLRRAAREIAGFRTALWVPMLRDGGLVGYISAQRPEPKPFAEREIALLRNFAAQAVIAMENARLLTETREALEQQTATAEVLQVINSSPGDLGPVFEAMLEKAIRLCVARRGQLAIYDGEMFRFVATRGEARFAQGIQSEPHPPSDGITWLRILDGENVVHIPDARETELYRSGHVQTRNFVEDGGGRSLLSVALRKDDVLLGVLSIYRAEVRPFSEKEIALLQNFAAQAVIAIENARLLTETREALDKQTAMAEILRVISESTSTIEPVFDAIVTRAARLCEADFSGVALFGDGLLNLVGVTLSDAESSAFRSLFPRPPSGDFVMGRAFLDGATVHVDDILEYPGFSPQVREALQTVTGYRTTLGVPILHDGKAIGVIGCARRQVKPFTPAQIELVRAFADQAVIAIENARLLGELRERTHDLEESLEYQTATSDVLQVISRSTFDLQPVLDTLLETAARLCGADMGHIRRREGEGYRLVGTFALQSEFDRFLRDQQQTVMPGRGSVVERTVLERRVVHVADIGADPDYTLTEAAKYNRTVLGVPLLREGEPVGVIVLTRRRVEPFTERQIELVRTFADQAVIAIENTRLLTETREALEQQTATAEVLQVINSSPGDLQPVFDVMLRKALRLCEVTYGHVATFDGECFHFQALTGDPRLVAYFGKLGPVLPPPGSVFERLVAGERVVHIADIADDPGTRVGSPLLRALAETGLRSLLSVALRKDDTLIGAIVMYRQEVRPFTDKQIALLQNFAAQAVIAMENARLLGELRERTSDLEESLEYQTATSNVLQVISRSTFDLQPILDTLTESAARLCLAEQTYMTRREGNAYRFVTAGGSTPEATANAVRFKEEILDRRTFVSGRETITGRVLLEGRAVQIVDAAADPEYALSEIVTVAKIRTLLGVPLMRGGEPIGTFNLARQRVEPFTERQIELVRTFADQAVIAMENTRLLTELRESLEQQQAIAEVLGVINASPGDLTPVFDAILEKAHNLCATTYGSLQTYDGEQFRAVATRGLAAAFAERLRQGYSPSAPHPTHRLFAGERFVQVPDISEIDEPTSRAAHQLAGIRTVLFVPLRQEGRLLGLISAARTEVRTYSDKEITLLENFAAQAVIAMENARLLGELRERTSDLEESLEYQTATSNVLQVISRSTFDLQPVLDAVVETAARLCDAEMGMIARRDGPVYRTASTFAFSPAFTAVARDLVFEPGRSSVIGRAAQAQAVVQVEDLAADLEYALPEVITVGQMRTALGVPLLREGEPVGVIYLARQRVEPFSEREIELVRTFADQAVIAIENTRLLTELRESLEQQQAIAEVLGVINANPGDLQPVLDAMLEKATRLHNAAFGVLSTIADGGIVIHRAFYGTPALAEVYGTRAPARPSAGGTMDRLINGERCPQVDDATKEDLSLLDERRRVVELAGVRTIISVGLYKDDLPIGAISLFRREVRRFSEREIAVLENFAAQAVIAMDNARLLDEIRRRQAELRVTFDSMGDGVAMFDADMRLAAWNMNFQRILDLPDDFVATRPTLREYVQYMSARGEYGAATPELEAEIRRGVAIAEHESRFERTRPDGTVIEVRRNAVPGGGSVLIFSDVTERKRAEAEIRDARDAAEQALAELRQTQQQLVTQQKMAALGQLTAGIAHEIKNPLNFVNNFASLSNELLDELKEVAEPAIQHLGDDKRAELDETIDLLSGNLRKIVEHGKRADNIVKGMLEHSRGASGERRQVDLNALVEEALNLAYHGARAQDQSFNITLERDFDDTLQPVELVPQDMTRVFLNLFGNGFYAAHKRARGDGEAQPALRVATRAAGDAVEVKVRDNGTGIPPEIREKLFQPFFTTKPTGEGTGLGLSISYDIVAQQHGGTITVDSEVGAFTEFTVLLPCGSATAQGGKAV